MALTDLKTVLDMAEQTKTAIPAFNIDSIPATEGLMEAAEAAECPVILAIGQAAIKEGREEIAAKAVRANGEAEDITLYVKGLTEDEKEIILEGCLMNYYAAQNR